MDQAVLVGGQVAGGEERIKQMQLGGLDITVAFWAKESESGNWYLYVASKDVDRDGALRAYRKVVDAVRLHPNPWADMLQIKLIGTDEPPAKAALAHRKRDLPTIYNNPYLGNLSIDEAFIYPENVTDGPS
jgi:hypothetical protein